MLNAFNGRATAVNGPANAFEAVTPSDAAALPGGVCRGLHVGVAGILRVEDGAGNIAEFASEAGQYHPLRVMRVHATGTTAGAIVALY